jgi:beta-lactamase class A
MQKELMMVVSDGQAEGELIKMIGLKKINFAKLN